LRFVAQGFLRLVRGQYLGKLSGFLRESSL
jgi:hypothetical protein